MRKLPMVLEITGQLTRHSVIPSGIKCFDGSKVNYIILYKKSYTVAYTHFKVRTINLQKKKNPDSKRTVQRVDNLSLHSYFFHFIITNYECYIILPIVKYTP